MSLPWEPLFTVERSDTPEVTVSGIISIVNGSGAMFGVGDISANLWSRSLLKPWQLLPNIPLLRKTYPVHSQHFAMMLASHNGESWHLDYLAELLQAGGLDETKLQCPACFPMSAESRFLLKSQGARPKTIYNPCSGKHIAYLLALAAQKKPLEDYMDRDSEHFKVLKELLGWLLERDPAGIAETTDGCRLPNYGFSSIEMASMYRLLADDLPADRLKSVPEGLTEAIEEWPYLRHLMRNHPRLVGGSDRLDTKLMGTELSPPEYALVAKEGAEGLLGIGLAACPQYPDGLGILIKLASGYDLRYLETIAVNLLQQLGIAVPSVADHSHHKEPYLQTRFHYRVPQPQTA